MEVEAGDTAEEEGRLCQEEMEPDHPGGPVEGAAGWEATGLGQDPTAIAFVPVAGKSCPISREYPVLI